MATLKAPSRPPSHAHQGRVAGLACANQGAPSSSAIMPSSSVPTRKDMNAACRGECRARRSCEFTPAWEAPQAPTSRLQVSRNAVLRVITMACRVARSVSVEGDSVSSACPVDRKQLNE